MSLNGSPIENTDLFRQHRPHSGHWQDRNSAVQPKPGCERSPVTATQFGSLQDSLRQRSAAAGLSRDGSNKATITAILAQQAGVSRLVCEGQGTRRKFPIAP